MRNLVIGVIIGVPVGASATYAASLHPYPVWQKTTAEYKIGYIDGLLDGQSHADHEISLDTPWPPSRET